MNVQYFILPHRDVEDTGILPAAGTIAAAFMHDPTKMENVERNKEYSITDFGTPPKDQAGLRVIFERRVGESK